MNTMKSSLLLLLAFTALGSAGCNKTPVRQLKDVKIKADLDPFRAALDIFRDTENARAGDEWTRFRAGCDQLNAHFTKASVVKGIGELSAKNRPFLEAEVRLTEDEFSEVESFSFRTADAHYLDECFLLHDASKAIEVPGLGIAEQAQIHFNWVMRNVLPHEQSDSWTPPVFTLRRGCGSPLERALVFLALLRQAQIEGCLIVVPEAEPKYVLVAALDDKESRLHLFDPQVGVALPSKDGKSVLTLNDAVPALLPPGMVAPGKEPKLEAWLVCPLYALSARNHELERGLRGRHPITLHLDAAWLAGEVAKATKLPVKVWNPRAKDQASANSPTRCLRLFLPKQEGGTDETDRVNRFTRARVPVQDVLFNLAQIGITRQLIPKASYETLLGITVDFFNKYDLQTREMYLAGQFEGVIRRQERLQRFAKNDALVGLVGDKAFEQERKDWVKRLNDASGAQFHADPRVRAQGQQAMQNLMGQDHFLRWMIEITKEEKLEHKHEMAVLTRILAVGARDYFDRELARTQAAMNHEKADHAEALVRVQKAPGAAGKAAARNAWTLARNSWQNFYLSPIVLDAMVKQRLEQLQRVDRDNPLDHLDKQVSLLESLHLDVQNYFRARLCLAECLEQLEGAKAANESRQATRDMLDVLAKKGLMLAEINKVKDHPFAKGRPVFQQRLYLLAHDWSEPGHYYWMKQHIDRKVAAAGK